MNAAYLILEVNHVCGFGVGLDIGQRHPRCQPAQHQVIISDIEAS